MQDIKLVPEFTKYLSLQRTRFFSEPCNHENVLKMINDELTTLTPLIDTIKQCKTEIHNWLDIGCGLAWIDLALSQTLAKNGCLSDNYAIHLFDKNKLEIASTHKPGGFKPTHPFYNSEELAVKMLTLNGVPKNNIRWTSADVGNLNGINLPQMDLVISMKAWGFHFPLEVYLDSVLALLKPDGYLVLDIRHEKPQQKAQLHKLKSLFKHHQVLLKSKKFNRWLFHQKK